MATDHGASPVTLMQAHELLTRIRPNRSAAAKTWLAYYRRSASVYAEMAEIDRGHHHECIYWANRERAKADRLATELSNAPAGRREEPLANPTVDAEL